MLYRCVISPLLKMVELISRFRCGFYHHATDRKQLNWLVSVLRSGVFHRPALLLVFALGLPAATVPDGTRLEIRLNEAVASYSSKKGTAIDATLIAPVVVDGQTLVPIGSRLRGRLSEVNRIGLGIRRGRATIGFSFDWLEFPDGTSVAVETKLAAIDNARETVDVEGRLQGIRATDVFGHRLAGIARNLFFWDPLIHAVLTGSTLAVIRFPESEIHLPAGTEMIFETSAAFDVRDDWTVPLPGVAANEAERALLNLMVRDVTPRTTVRGGHKEADIVNILFAGEEEWLERAFEAAGWVKADPLTRRTGWATFTSVAESRAYPEAPMSEMWLDELPPSLELSKTLNTYSKRHHIRLWPQESLWRDRPVYAAASTQDIGIDFMFRKLKLTHVIDRNIDNERTKVINDLVYAGCVDAAELVDRPWVPRDAKNSTGDHLITDGRVLVIELNPCRAPRIIPRDQRPIRTRGNFLQRVPRQMILTIRNDFSRNNPVFQAGLGVRYLFGKMFRREPRPPQPERSGELVLATRD